jgi:hypothetical protein
LRDICGFLDHLLAIQEHIWLPFAGMIPMAGQTYADKMDPRVDWFRHHTSRIRQVVRRGLLMLLQSVRVVEAPGATASCIIPIRCVGGLTEGSRSRTIDRVTSRRHPGVLASARPVVLTSPTQNARYTNMGTRNLHCCGAIPHF